MEFNTKPNKNKRAEGNREQIGSCPRQVVGRWGKRVEGAATPKLTVRKPLTRGIIKPQHGDCS